MTTRRNEVMIDLKGIRFLRQLLCIVVLLATSMPVLAVDPPGYVGYTDIEEIAVQPNGRIYIKLATATPDLGCPGNDDGWLELNTAFPFFKEQYSLILTAFAASRQVQFYVLGCGHYPYGQNTRVM